MTKQPEAHPDLVAFIERLNNKEIFEREEGMMYLDLLHDRGNFMMLIKLYQSLIEYDPDEPVYRHKLAALYFQIHEFDKAEKLYRELVDTPLALVEPLILHHLGLIVWRKGNYDQAVDYWQQAVMEHPAFSPAYQALIFHARENGKPQRAESLKKQMEEGQKLKNKGIRKRILKYLLH